MSKPILIIGGRQSGKTTKAQEWAVERAKHAPAEDHAYMAMSAIDAKRQFTDILEEVEARGVRYSSLSIELEEGGRLMVGQPRWDTRGHKFWSAAVDQMTPEGLALIHNVMVTGGRALATLDSSEWDITTLEDRP